LAEFIYPLPFKRGGVLLSVAAGRLTAAKATRKNEQGTTRRPGATANGSAPLKRWRPHRPAVGPVRRGLWPLQACRCVMGWTPRRGRRYAGAMRSTTARPDARYQYRALYRDPSPKSRNRKHHSARTINRTAPSPKQPPHGSEREGGGAAATFSSLTPKAAGKVFPRGQSTQGKQAAALAALYGDNLGM
jgi:hypothetical protein